MPEDYQWRKNLSCTATYAILEDDDMLDQFEAKDVPFDEAGKFKVGDLMFYPTLPGSDITEMLAMLMARKFVKHLLKKYQVSYEEGKSKGKLILALGDILADGEKQLVDIAACVDDNVHFPDE